MPTILREMPFFSVTTALTVQGSSVRVKADQIIVWVSVGRQGRANLPSDARRFPAILDTGHSHNFSIGEHQLAEWAGYNLSMLQRLGRIRVHGRPIPLLAANLGLYFNQAGERDLLQRRSPFVLQLDGGISVYPVGSPDAPRLPLLGLRSLRRNRLHLTVDCATCRVNLRTKRRFWLFG